MAITINGSGTITGISAGGLPDGSVTSDDIADDAVTADKLDVGQLGGRRNLIINGAMQVAQRGTSETGITAGGYYTLDRWNMVISSLGTWTQSQESDAPDGYKNSLKLVPTTANASPIAGAYFQLETRLEAQDLERLSYGNSDAKSITFSFWVKSNKTGTYNLRLYRTVDSTRMASKQYTVNASGVWEHKTITFDGDTATGLTGDNGLGFSMAWWLGGGTTYTSGSNQEWGSYAAANEAPSQVNVADSTSNYFQITGVQLEVGSVATPFEHRSYGEELALCERYYQIAEGFGGNSYAGTAVGCDIQFKTEMRASPTVSANAAIQMTQAGVADYNQSSANAAIIGGRVSIRAIQVSIGNLSGISNNIYHCHNISANNAKLLLDAEL